MDSEGPAQASEMPLNMSDYVNFDLDDDIQNPIVGWGPRSSGAEPLQDIRVDDSYVGFDDAEETVLAGMFGSPDGSNMLGSESDAVEVTSAESGETDAATRDFNTLSPTSEDSDMTDIFQTTTETDDTPDDRKIFEPMAFTNPAALETPRSPSRWVPVSPQLQQQLNAEYASQLDQLAADPNPPPVLYLPTTRPCAPPIPSTCSVPNGDLPRTDSAQTPQLNAETLSVDPSVLMRSKRAVLPPLPTNFYVSKGKNPALTPIKKRSLNASDSNSEPATKRTKTAAKNEHSVDESDEEAEDDPKTESDDNDLSRLSSPPASPVMTLSPVSKGTSVPLSSNTGPKNGPNWRYEQTSEFRLRNQRRMEWNRRRTIGASTKGEAPNRKMQKLLEEMEDTMEFAEARGYEVRESMGGHGLLRRSARKGARKNYAGSE